MRKFFPSLNTRLIWLLIAAFGLADFIGLRAANIAITANALWSIAIRMLLLVILAMFYTYYRPDRRIATLAHSLAAILSSIVALGIFSYLTVVWSQSLIDARLVAVDQAIGFDWPAAYKQVTAYPWVYKGLFFAYCCLVPQLIALVFIFNYTGRIGRCWEMLWLYIVATVITLPFSVFWPAHGAFGYFHIQNSEPYVATFESLRSGTFRNFGSGPIWGVIQFPSLHAAGAVIFPYAARGIKYLSGSFLALNILMFVSTPFIGGHHLADLLGGIAVAAAAILIVRKLFPAHQVEEVPRFAVGAGDAVQHHAGDKQDHGQNTQ